MSDQKQTATSYTKPVEQERHSIIERPALPPVPNYSLATVFPSCDSPVIRRACKVRCERCGFMWDCSEL
jgi:hypothetical protein